MNSKWIPLLAATALIVSILAGLTWYQNQSMNMGDNNSGMKQKNMQMSEGTKSEGGSSDTNNHDYAKNIVKPKNGQPIKKFSLVAKEAVLMISENMSMNVWTFNGKVPGEEIRVTQGDFVQVELKNELKDPVTIHWHGYPLLSAMDGVPGLNQDSVKPGETFTYEFSADIPGTYWYHSHQEGAKQVDKGLYGALIVEPKGEPKADKDYTLILDELAEKPEEDMGSMPGMDMSKKSGKNDEANPIIAEEEMMAESYNIYTVNGKSGDFISPLEVKKGDVVRLRFINAGYRTHGIHVPGQDIKVVSTDGQEIQGATWIQDQVVFISPGERYDIEFKITGDENFVIDAHDNNKYKDQLKIPVTVVDGSGKEKIEGSTEKLQTFDFTSYGTPGKGNLNLEQNFDVDYSVRLSSKTVDDELKYTINGQTFEELPPLKVNTGDLVKMTFVNMSMVDHPMHLHGHFFQILSKNGKPLSGSPIIKDTLLVRPGEKYVVAFIADNPGNWVQHCHELHHAAAGMMQKIIYADFKSNYTPDPNNKDNIPE